MKLFISIGITLFAFAALGAKKDCTDVKQFKDVSKKEMQRIIAANSATIIDANSKAQFESGPIPKAKHYGSNKKNFKSVLPSKLDAPIVAYCGGPGCTAWEKAAIDACKMGYTNIRHFSEGLRWWQKQANKKKPKKS